MGLPISTEPVKVTTSTRGSPISGATTSSSGADKHREHPARQAGFVKQGGEASAVSGALFRGLENHGRARGDGRGEFVGHLVERVVERRDRGRQRRPGSRVVKIFRALPCGETSQEKICPSSRRASMAANSSTSETAAGLVARIVPGGKNRFRG